MNPVDLDVLAASAEEMKGYLKETLDRLDTSNLKEEGTVGKNGRFPKDHAPSEGRLCPLSQVDTEGKRIGHLWYGSELDTGISSQSWRYA